MSLYSEGLDNFNINFYFHLQSDKLLHIYLFWFDNKLTEITFVHVSLSCHDCFFPMTGFLHHA